MPASSTPVRQKQITMYITTWCGEGRIAKRWLDAHNIPYNTIDIERDEQAAAEVLRINAGMRSVPTIVFPDGSVLAECRLADRTWCLG